MRLTLFKTPSSHNVNGKAKQALNGSVIPHETIKDFT